MANPFKPSFGVTPPILVGRDGPIEDFAEALEDGPGSSGRATIYTGARGSGKTVMLNAVEDRARSLGWVVISETASPGFVERIVRQWLGPLLDYDVAHNAELTPTLGEFLELGGHYAAAAKRLSLHPSTLKYRLRRIREISGLDLGDPDGRTVEPGAHRDHRLHPVAPGRNRVAEGGVEAVRADQQRDGHLISQPDVDVPPGPGDRPGKPADHPPGARVDQTGDQGLCGAEGDPMGAPIAHDDPAVTGGPCLERGARQLDPPLEALQGHRCGQRAVDRGRETTVDLERVPERAEVHLDRVPVPLDQPAGVLLRP